MCHLQLNGGRDDHALPQIPDAEHKRRSAVPRRNDCVPREDEGFCSPVGLSRLHEHTAQHDGVDDQAQNVLDDEDNDGQRTFFRHHPSSETNSDLTLRKHVFYDLTNLLTSI